MKHISGKAIAFSDARREERVSGVQLAKEIKPFFEEFFLGETVLNDGDLFYHLPNGQKFKLSFIEVG